jgi:hypothetical protein
LLAGGLVLDAFGDDSQAQVAAQVDGGADDDRVAVAGGHLGDKGAVDLEFMDWEGLEVAMEE